MSPCCIANMLLRVCLTFEKPAAFITKRNLMYVFYGIHTLTAWLDNVEGRI